MKKAPNERHPLYLPEMQKRLGSQSKDGICAELLQSLVSGLFRFLDGRIPGAAAKAVVKKTAIDMFMFAPFSLSAFLIRTFEIRRHP